MLTAVPPTADKIGHRASRTMRPVVLDGVRQRNVHPAESACRLMNNPQYFTASHAFVSPDPAVSSRKDCSKESLNRSVHRGYDHRVYLDSSPRTVDMSGSDHYWSAIALLPLTASVRWVTHRWFALARSSHCSVVSFDMP